MHTIPHNNRGCNPLTICVWLLNAGNKRQRNNTKKSLKRFTKLLLNRQILNAFKNSSILDLNDDNFLKLNQPGAFQNVAV